MVQTTEVPLNEHGVLKKIKAPTLSKYGIYIIRRGAEVIRIGESSSGFERIVKGFRQKLRHIRGGKERKNYLAYSWRENYLNESLHVDYFPLDAASFSEDHLRRALEAEITFQFRIVARAWPKNMSEIHFLERYRTTPVLVTQASAVMAHYGHTYSVAV